MARVGGTLWNVETDRWKILGLSLLTGVRKYHPGSYLGNITQPVVFPGEYMSFQISMCRTEDNYLICGRVHDLTTTATSRALRQDSTPIGLNS